MADLTKDGQVPSIQEAFDNFNNMHPRTITATADIEDRFDKTGQTFTGGAGSGFNTGFFANMGGGQNNIYRNPVRRFYDPEITTTAIYLPRNIRQKNRWCRWFFDHDEFVGAVLELHAELPYSRAEILLDDPVIKRHVEDCMDKTKFFSMLPVLDLEFMKVGEVFIHTPWDSTEGMWTHIIPHNPDFVEVRATPFADTECVIELKPDEELKKIIHSTKPEDQQLKKRLPKDIVKRVLTGKNILLDSSEVTHIARRSNPYDIRGTSLLNRLFRLLMYEDKLREAQITIADNFIYPLKVFKLGDPQKGWIPDETHQRALSQMLQNANMDPNFSLIYHYGLQVEYITVADRVMRLDKEWQEISDKKMIALGVSKEFLSGSTTYAAANVGLQIQLARYKAKRDLFEIRWIQDKFFRIMAERNGWYKRDAREILGQFRVTRKGEELRKRLIMPKLMWHKKLMMRDDQQFLTFLHNVHAQGKGPVSAITLLMGMGLDAETELHNKNKQKELEEMIGSYLQAPPAQPPVGGAPGLGAIAKLKDKFKIGKDKKGLLETPSLDETTQREFIAQAEKDGTYLSATTALTREKQNDLEIVADLIPINNDEWHKNIQSPYVPAEVVFALNSYDGKLRAIDKKYNGNFRLGILENTQDLLKSLVDVYMQGKFTSYKWTDFLPIYRQHYAEGQDLRDYSDLAMSSEIEDWVTTLASLDMEKGKMYRHIRDLSNTCYCFGQLKGFQEQGVFSVKISNSPQMDGLRYTAEELTKKGKSLSSLVSPMGELVIFAPCIEGFDDPDLGNTIDPKIQRHKNTTIGGIRIKECPVEYVPFLERYINKLGKYLKKQCDTILFVKDVVELPEWETARKAHFEEEYKHVKAEVRVYSVMNAFIQDRTVKMGKVPTFKDGRTLFISSWIGMEDVPITANFIKYIDIDEDSLNRTITKNFGNVNFDLSPDEIETYKVFGYIEPVLDHKEATIGWEAAKNVADTPNVDEKVVYGKSWDSNGKCVNAQYKDPRRLFEDNLKLWIDYPHKLNPKLISAFEEL